jgi:hypothetical protein
VNYSLEKPVQAEAAVFELIKKLDARESEKVQNDIKKVACF